MSVVDFELSPEEQQEIEDDPEVMKMSFKTLGLELTAIEWTRH